MKRTLLISSLFLALAAVGCSDDDAEKDGSVSQDSSGQDTSTSQDTSSADTSTQQDGSTDATDGGGETGTGRVKTVHASPDAPAVNLKVDDGDPIGELAFTKATAYLEIPAGSRNLKAIPVGETTAAIDADVTIEDGKSYTVFAADVVASIAPVVAEDDLTAPASGKAHVRFAHMSPDAPAVDIVPQGGSALFSNAKFKDVTAFTPVDAGTVTIEVQKNSDSAVVLTVPDVKLEEGVIYTIWASGKVADLGAQIIVNAPEANLMAVHASPDAPGVALKIDGVQQNSTELTFKQNAGYLKVEGGERQVEVAPFSGGASVIDANVTFESGKAYTVFAADVVASITPVVAEDDLSDPATGKAHVRFAHMSPDAPAVDIVPQGGSALFSNAKFKDVTDFTPVDAGTVTIEVQKNSDSSVVLTVPDMTLDAGKIYTIWASGKVANLAAEVIVNK